MGDAGRKLVCERFTLDGMVRGYELLIENIYRESYHNRMLAPARFEQIVEQHLRERFEEQKNNLLDTISNLESHLCDQNA